MKDGWILAFVFALSILGTGATLRYARLRGVLDIPNDRSSHHLPTPRGGGIAIVVAFLTGIVVLFGFREVASSTVVALVGSGAAVATIGFLDDHRPVAARWRLLAHFAAAAWLLFWFGGVPPLQVVDRVIEFGVAGNLIAIVALVWLLNLFNFMDGIDGIAAVEAVSACFGAIILGALNPVGGNAWVLLSMLALAALGFLYWNFPPAKIFMGDAGSGFLGMMLGALAMHTAGVSPRWLWHWLILLAVFVVDTGLTLLRRVLRGENVAQAHRYHAYQHAAVRLGSHRRVTLAVAVINVFGLLPLAILVEKGYINGAVGTTIAYAALLLLALRFDGGVNAGSSAASPG